MPLKDLIALCQASAAQTNLLWKTKKEGEKLDGQYRKHPPEKRGQPSQVRWIAAAGHRFRCKP